MSIDNTKKITKLAAIATIIGTFITCCAAVAAFGTWFFPDIIEIPIISTPFQNFLNTYLPTTITPQLSLATSTIEPIITIKPIIDPDSVFNPSQYTIDETFICETILNTVVECIKNKLAITITFPSTLGAKGIISSPGYPSLEFYDLEIGESIKYHNATTWFEIRFDDYDGSKLIMHITSFSSKY